MEKVQKCSETKSGQLVSRKIFVVQLF